MTNRMLLPMFCLAGLIVGCLTLVSPIYINGGIVGWIDSSADSWMGTLFGMVLTVLLGLVVVVVSGPLAVTFGLVFAAESAVNARSRARAIRELGQANSDSSVYDNSGNH